MWICRFGEGRAGSSSGSESGEIDLRIPLWVAKWKLEFQFSPQLRPLINRHTRYEGPLAGAEPCEFAPQPPFRRRRIPRADPCADASPFWYRGSQSRHPCRAQFPDDSQSRSSSCFRPDSESCPGLCLHLRRIHVIAWPFRKGRQHRNAAGSAPRQNLGEGKRTFVVRRQTGLRCSVPSTPSGMIPMKDVVTLEETVWVDPDRMSGAPYFRGSRLPVQQLFDWLADGVPLDEFVEEFRIDRRAAEAVLRAAGARFSDRNVETTAEEQSTAGA